MSDAMQKDTQDFVTCDAQRQQSALVPRTAAMTWVKRCNVIVSIAVVILFVLHGAGNALQLFAMGSLVPAALGWAMAWLVCAHAAMGVVLTVFTFIEQRRAGVAYGGLNKRFWAVRASGFALMLLLLFHVHLFGGGGTAQAGVFRLALFGEVELVAHVLLVAALAVHVLCNVEPLLIDVGVPASRARAVDVLVVIAILLAIMAAAFVVYYLRWSVI